MKKYIKPSIVSHRLVIESQLMSVSNRTGDFGDDNHKFDITDNNGINANTYDDKKTENGWED